MNLQAELDQFRDDNSYDVETQAKRLLATNNTKLLLYVLALGLVAAKQRQRHQEREFIKNVGAAPQERLIPGRVTGSVVSIKPITSRRRQNAMQQYIADVWMVGEKRLGDCNHSDLAVARARERASADGHNRNDQLYGIFQTKLDPKDNRITHRQRWDEKEVRGAIEKVYGEFRKSPEAA